MKWSAFTQRRYSIVHLSCFAVVLCGSVGLISWSDIRRTANRLQSECEELKRVVQASPLPNVVLAPDSEIPAGKAYAKDYVISMPWASRRFALWEQAMRAYKGRPGVAYLEIGAFEGGSVLWMLENVLTDPTARCTVIDLFDGDYKETYGRNLELSGSAAKVTSITGYSQIALRSLPLDSFDIIYVDGSHKKCDVLEDAVLSWRLLKAGGLLIFDDYRHAQPGWDYRTRQYTPHDIWFPKGAIDPFVQCFEDQVTVVHNAEQLIVKKKM